MLLRVLSSFFLLAPRSINWIHIEAEVFIVISLKEVVVSKVR